MTEAEDSEKFLIFAAHYCVMDKLENLLTQNRVRYVRMDGSTTPETRHSSVSSFQNDPHIRCAILSIAACCAGITMTAASEIIFAELDWTPNTIIQAEGRAHRIGQSREVKCYFLVAPNTADDVMWEMLMAKQHNLTKAGLVGINEHLSNFTSSEFQAGPSKPTQLEENRITEYFQNISHESENLPPDMNLTKSKDSSQSFYTCKDFDDTDLDDTFADANTDVAPQEIMKASVENAESNGKEDNLEDIIFDEDENWTG